MACKCIDNCEEKLLKTIAENHPNWKIDKYGTGFANKVWMFDQNLYLITMVFNVEHEVTAKNGNVRTKKETININGVYCPFCGKKFEELEKKEKALSKEFMTDFETWEKELKRIVLAETGKEPTFESKTVRPYYDVDLTPKEAFDKYWDV